MDETHSDSGKQHQDRPWNENIPQNLPNSKLVLLLGILSIASCWLYLISSAGVVLAIVALFLSGNEMATYKADPTRYSISSLNNVKAGRTLALIGLIISVVVFIFLLLLITGFIVSLPFWGMM
jgi:hypothetical protein